VEIRFDQPGSGSLPPALPGPDWSQPAYRLCWSLLNLLTGLNGQVPNPAARSILSLRKNRGR
jgi:hypothetical protein